MNAVEFLLEASRFVGGRDAPIETWIRIPTRLGSYQRLRTNNSYLNEQVMHR
jgi:hypothetical protein